MQWNSCVSVVNEKSYFEFIVHIMSVSGDNDTVYGKC